MSNEKQMAWGYQADIFVLVIFLWHAIVAHTHFCPIKLNSHSSELSLNKLDIFTGYLVEAEELVMPKEGTYARPAAVTHIDRPAGQNDVGIVAWVLTLKTPECPQGRQVYFLASQGDHVKDASEAFGSFSRVP